jgi:hypothetical protein
MAEQQETPVTRRGLRVITGDVTAPAGSAPAPVTTGAVVPMTLPERGRRTITRWLSTAARIAGQIWPPFGRALYRLWHPEPETMAEHRAYIRSMAWVPPELSGRKSGIAIAAAGIAYHVLIGHPLKAAMRAVRKAAENTEVAAERPLRLFLLAVFVSALVLILLHL